MTKRLFTDEDLENLYNRFSKSFDKLHVYELKERISELENELIDQENEMIDLEEELSKAYKKIKELEAANKPKPARKWKCPIDFPGCEKNCGSYGCGN